MSLVVLAVAAVIILGVLHHSDSLLQVLDTAARAAHTHSTVLIRGKTGSGKELLARAIHFNRPGREEPLATVNGGTIPGDLLGSELFGHKCGSFKGAVADPKGRIEMAHGGTLFRDEIGEMPTPLQVKSLCLIQEGEVGKIGSVTHSRVDVCIITATHHDLQAMIEGGPFREDLYYRLAVIPLMLPPLRERVEDIPGLVPHFIRVSRDKNHRPDLAMSPALLRHFIHYRWRGNARELENVVEGVVVLVCRNEVTLDDLPRFLRREKAGAEALEIELPPQGIRLEGIEKELILKALQKCAWN
jgi:two-component system, NtrC family, response regulator